MCGRSCICHEERKVRREIVSIMTKGGQLAWKDLETQNSGGVTSRVESKFSSPRGSSD
jgi:hypothetical protein